MLAINQPKSDSQPATAHLLPCRIHHDGKVDINNHVWNPEVVTKDGENDSHVVHFRGRKLLGQVVQLPTGYHASALRVTQNTLPEIQHTNDGDESTKQTESVLQIDKIIVWKHESLAEATEDPYLKGMGEWMKLADTIHSS